MREIVQSFVTTFQKAVRAEMGAMQEQLGPFEVPVSAVHAVETSAEDRFRLHELTVLATNEKLVLNGECTLVHDSGELLVTITAIERDCLTVRTEREIPRDSSSYRLVIYPWFLYERLLVTLEDLPGAFGSHLMRVVLGAGPAQQRRMIGSRQHRLERVRRLCQERIEQIVGRLHGKEKAVVEGARVVLATMTNMYISPLLSRERFDAVIVEEAGMAVLPTLFYCAGLGGKKIIAVGDPRQLPPIVLSRDRYVAQAMGRSIFDITVPESHDSDAVVMLDTQYRMHPVIGSLVSDLFYEGRLLNDDSTSERDSIAERGPFPGHALVVVDTCGKTTCERQGGSYSRFNERTAEACVELAREAIGHGIESVAIITPYAQQSSHIRKLLSGLPDADGRIECRTVHRFQGNERDLVILDTVDTAPMRPGVLLAGRKGSSSAPHLVNVSISRARGKLVIVADAAYFKANAPGSTIDRVLDLATRSGQRVSWTPG